MFSEWLTSDDFPGTRVHVRPLEGPQLLDLAVAQAMNNGARGGKASYAAVEFAIIDWEHVPLLRGKFSEEYDAGLINQLAPGFVAWLARELELRAYLSEDEEKNSESQST